MNFFYLTSKLIPLIAIISNVIILYYVNELEKDNCECSENWKRDFIKVSSIVIGVFSIVLLFTLFNVRIVAGLFSLLNIAHLIISISYFVRLKRSKCLCSKDWKRYFLLYPIIGLLVSFTLTFVYFFIVGREDFLKEMFIHLHKLNKLGKEASLTTKKMKCTIVSDKVKCVSGNFGMVKRTFKN